MDLNEQKNRLLIFMCIIVVLIVLGGGFYLAYRSFFKKVEEEKPKKEKPVVTDVSDFDIKLIKEINKTEKGNYLISPYSVEYALGMLRDGAAGNTKKEIEDLVGNRKINNLKIKDRINVANGLFINDEFKDKVLDIYTNTIKNKYNGEIVYDSLKTPAVINEWVNKQTYGMIPKLTDNLNPNVLMVLVNALAIDVEWKYDFNCVYTKNKEFTKSDGTKYDVSMMYESFEGDSVQYFKTDDAEGVVLPYKEYDKSGSNLEFIGILPDEDVNKYVDNLTKEKIAEIYDSMKNAEVKVSLPRFSYDYKVEDFKKSLQNLGIKDALDEKKADLSQMIETPAYVGQAIHKTHISLNEKGTKAAAVTGIEVDSKAAYDPDAEEPKKVEFNKPFAYIIRDKETKEMLFFGVVYEPEKWNGKTCEK